MFMLMEGICASSFMPTDGTPPQTCATGEVAESDGLIDRLAELPEPQALEFYSQLSPRLQWLARQRTTGQRRKALIAHHVITAGRCR
jgi:hypothetical protein